MLLEHGRQLDNEALHTLMTEAECIANSCPLWSYDDADHLEFPLKQIGSEILSFQQAQDILIDIYYNCIWAHM